MPTHDNLGGGTAFIVPIWQVEKLSHREGSCPGRVCATAGLLWTGQLGFSVCAADTESTFPCGLEGALAHKSPSSGGGLARTWWSTETIH